MTKEFITGCIHMMMDVCGVREYRIEDGADKFVTALSWAGTAAYTVTVFPDSIPENNW